MGMRPGPALADPAPDVYAVVRGPAGYLVKHFTSAKHSKPCCVLTVTPGVGETDVDALTRGAAQIQRNHGGPTA